MMMIIRMSALVGTVLAEARAVAGLSGRDLSRRSGIDEGYVGKYERSRVIPGTDVLTRLLDPCGFVLAAVPKRDAGTYQQRDAVIEAARIAADVFRGTDALGAPRWLVGAVDALVEAEKSPLAVADGHPLDEIQRLRTENERLRRQVESLIQAGWTAS